MRDTAARLPRLRLSHPSGSAAEVYLQGAHVTSWIPAGGSEALFLSRAATFQPGKAIRGGVPVVFPQFAELGPLPKHGFARVQPWERVDHADRPGAVRLRLRDSDETRRIWPHAFVAELVVEIGGDWLSLGLTIRNTGDAAFKFTAALHTYLRVGDVRRATVQGLQGVRYRDRDTGEQGREDEDHAVSIQGEVDRVYLNTPRELRVHDPRNQRTFLLRAEGFADTVVWNPWASGAASLPDMEDDEYREMLCVEAAQVAEPVRLEAGASWTGSQRLQVIGFVEPIHRSQSS
ncbi:MAG: D-hexose-6-phosphate mutarotase [Gemmatimonadetes bacterium]|nr:D-hexose-6-phosphate mutarotase [Gemmatimonadota bacterium]